VRIPFITETEDKNPTVGLTEAGRRKAESPGSSGLLSRALYILHQQGPTSQKELGKRLRIDKARARYVVLELLKNKDVRIVD